MLQRVATITTTVTVAVTNTFQQALPSASRNSCTIQYTGTHTGYVYFGVLGSATTSNAFQLLQGQSINCSINGVVLTDAVNVTGTGSDTFVVTTQ